MCARWRRRARFQMQVQEGVSEMTNLWKWEGPRDLQWGETPWNTPDMPREQLVREVQRMYAALTAARGPLWIAARDNADHPYWKRGGIGGDALEMVEQALSPYKGNHDGNGYEPAYRSFFRFATDLLFDGFGFGWAICKNEHLLALHDGKRVEVCERCRASGDGEAFMRPLQWSDLEPRK